MDWTSIVSVFLNSQAFGVIIGGLFTAGAAYIGVSKTIKGQLDLERERQRSLDQQKRHQAYSELIGRKYSLSQTTQSYLISNLSRAYLNLFHHLATLDSEKVRLFQLYLEESKECSRILRDIARYTDRFWATIGLIQAIFPQTAEQEDLIAKIRKPEAALANFDRSLSEDINAYLIRISHKNEMGTLKTELNAWRDQKTTKSIGYIKNFESSVDALIDHLDREMLGRMVK